MDNVTKELVTEVTSLSKKLAETEAELSKYKNIEVVYTFNIMKELADSNAFKIRGVLLAEGTWLGSKFSYEYMKKFAHKFVGADILKDHGKDPKFGRMIGGKITKVVPNDTLRCLAFEGDITDESFRDLIRNKVVDAISASATWRVDRSTGEEVVVDINEKLPKEGSLTASPVCEFCNLFSFGLSNYEEEINRGLDSTDLAGNIMVEDNGAISYVELSLAVWTTAYINKLPDSAFAYISPGGKKDKEGKTVPRSLRHLPYKDNSGKIDVPHLRNAISRAPQAKIPAEVKKIVQAKLQRLLARIKGKK